MFWLSIVIYAAYSIEFARQIMRVKKKNYVCYFIMLILIFLIFMILIFIILISNFIFTYKRANVSLTIVIRYLLKQLRITNFYISLCLFFNIHSLTVTSLSWSVPWLKVQLSHIHWMINPLLKYLTIQHVFDVSFVLYFTKTICLANSALRGIILHAHTKVLATKKPMISTEWKYLSPHRSLDVF